MIIIKEFFFSGYNYNILSLLYVLSIVSSILVIVSKNPIVSVLFLIGLFISISLYLVLLGLVFIGLSYLIVYIGAVSILFLFILMLINIRLSEIQSNTKSSIPLSVFIILLSIMPFLGVLSNKIYKFIDLSNIIYYASNTKEKYMDNLEMYNIFVNNNNNNFNKLYVLSNIWDGGIGNTSHITNIGNIMYTSHNIWLIVVSLILLLTMVGTIVITIKQDKKKK